MVLTFNFGLMDFADNKHSCNWTQSVWRDQEAHDTPGGRFSSLVRFISQIINQRKKKRN